MSNMEIQLTRKELFEAIYEYVERKYPVKTTYATIEIDRKFPSGVAVTGVKVSCIIKEKERPYNIQVGSRQSTIKSMGIRKA